MGSPDATAGMAPDLTRIDALIAAAGDAAATRRLALGSAQALVAACAVVALTALADAQWALPAAVRLGLMLAAGSLLLVPAGLACVLHRLRPDQAGARDLAEAGLDDRSRPLTAAGELAAMPGPLAAEAAARIARILPEDADPLRGVPPSRAWRWLVAVPALACAGLALHLLLPTFWPMVGPRLYAPFADHPPFSQTRLHWDEAPARLRPGDAPRFAIIAEGPAPTAVTLHATGALTLEVPLVRSGDSTWEVVLVALPDGAWTETDPVATAWIDGAGTRTTFRSIPVDPVPVLRSLTLTVVQPAYAQLPDTVVKGDAKSPPLLSLLPGAMLRLAATANRPFDAMLVQRDDSRIARLAAGAFVLTDPAPGRLLVALANGPWAGTPVTLARIERRVDAPPTVSFELPESDAVATPGALIQAVIRAEDDLGLASLTRYLVVGDRTVMEQVETLGGTGDAWRGQIRLADVKPGDEVRIGAVARDTCPPTGQLSAPAERRIRIISDAQYNQLVREQIAADALITKYTPLLQRLAELEAAAAPPAAGEDQTKRDERLQAQRDRIAKVQAEVAALRRPEHVFPIEKELLDAIEQRVAELEQAAREGRPASGADRAGELAEDLDEVTGLGEDAALQEALADLAAAQDAVAKDLADLKRRIAEGDAPSDADRARLRELADRQAEIQDAVAAWEALAADAGGRLEKKHPLRAQRLAAQRAALRDGKIDQLTGEAATQARRGHSGPAADRAATAAELLAKLAATAHGQGECSGKGWCKGDAMGQCRSQIAGLARRGLGRGGAPGNRSSGGGAVGGAGMGLVVGQGGMPGAQVPVFGPEPIASKPGRPGGGGPGRDGKGMSATLAPDGAVSPPTPYEQGVRATTASTGVHLSPEEQRLVDDYWRRLDGDPLAPEKKP